MANTTKPVQLSSDDWQDLQFKFDGQWLPDIDPFLIGPNNYERLINMRYLDSGLEGVSGYTRRVTHALDGSTTNLGNFPKIRNGSQLRTENTQKTYTMVHSQDTSNQGRVFINRTAIGSVGDFDGTSDFDVNGNPYYEDSESGLIGRFSEGPQGNLGYCNGAESMLFGGDEQRLAALFTTDDTAGANPIDQTSRANNELQDAANVWTVDMADQYYQIIMTTRPIQAIKFYVKTANTVTSTMTVKTWEGSAWGSDLVGTDGTSDSGVTLAKTGTVDFSAHTESSAVLKHFEELYLYAYLVTVVDATNAATADLYNATVNMGFQKVKDVWDGVYRQPIQAQVYDNSATTWSDYTLHVQEPSDTNTPVGMILDAAEGGASYDKDYIIMMFEDRQAAFKFTMLSGLVNTNTSAIKVYYWTGDAWSDASATDGTSSGGKTMGQTGLITWSPPSVSAERPKTLFGSFGYAYKIAFGATLSGTGGGTEEVLVDIITGIPAQQAVKPFDFSVLYKTMIMLGSFSKGNEGNRLDYCVANAPDVWNGTSSSDHGTYSLYFGGTENIVAATQLYNRFSSSVLSMLLVLKRNETYILTGSDPDTFTIYPVSYSVGCPAPLTLATAEVGHAQEGKSTITRNVAVWVSHSGPLMFDGAVLSPIHGIRKYFDPDDDAYLEWDQIERARGWIDPVFKEYNLLVPSGAGAAENNVWLVYDLVRKKWYRKQVGTTYMPQAAFEVVADDGERMVYAGIDTGYMMQLEEGTSWDGTGIEQIVRTGDFTPSSNIWDESTIRKLKITVKKIPDSSNTNTLLVYYYKNTDADPGTGVTFIQTLDTSSGISVVFTDSDDVEWATPTSSSLNLDMEVGLQRLIRIIDDLNYTGWAHAFEFRLTTSDVVKGFQPIAWGVRYRIERKDDTATS